MTNQEERYFEVSGTITKTWFFTDGWFKQDEALSMDYGVTFSFTRNGEEKEYVLTWGVTDEKEEYQQLCNMGKMLGTANPQCFKGKRVRLIFGLNTNISEETLVGIGEENSNLFIIPYYLFSCSLKEEDKQFFYSKDEVLEKLSKIEVQGTED